MSWGGGEFSSEKTYDSHFPQSSGIVYFASSGDSGGVVEYSSCSPNVVAVGGTTLTLNSNSTWKNETGWSGTGGGKSKYEARPSYQDKIQGTVGSSRGVPDISAVANPNTGVSVLWNGSWLVFGGTSVAAPCVAGMANSAGHFQSSSTAELSNYIYKGLSSSFFHDILSGSAGRNKCASGWDFVTGVGSPNGLGGL